MASPYWEEPAGAKERVVVLQEWGSGIYHPDLLPSSVSSPVHQGGERKARGESEKEKEQRERRKPPARVEKRNKELARTPEGRKQP